MDCKTIRHVIVHQGLPAIVVKVDYGNDPPSYVVRMEKDDNEVGCERTHLNETCDEEQERLHWTVCVGHMLSILFLLRCDIHVYYNPLGFLG